MYAGAAGDAAWSVYEAFKLLVYAAGDDKNERLSILRPHLHMSLNPEVGTDAEAALQAMTRTRLSNLRTRARRCSAIGGWANSTH